MFNPANVCYHHHMDARMAGIRCLIGFKILLYSTVLSIWHPRVSYSLESIHYRYLIYFSDRLAYRYGDIHTVQYSTVLYILSITDTVPVVRTAVTISRV